MTDLHKRRALRYATDLMDEYATLLEDTGCVRHLLAMAYLQGSVDGSDETRALLARELDRMIPEPQSLKAR